MWVPPGTYKPVSLLRRYIIHLVNLCIMSVRTMTIPSSFFGTAVHNTAAAPINFHISDQSRIEEIMYLHRAMNLAKMFEESLRKSLGFPNFRSLHHRTSPRYTHKQGSVMLSMVETPIGASILSLNLETAASWTENWVEALFYQQG